MRTLDAKAARVDFLRFRADAESADHVGRDDALLIGEVAEVNQFPGRRPGKDSPLSGCGCALSHRSDATPRLNAFNLSSKAPNGEHRRAGWGRAARSGIRQASPSLPPKGSDPAPARIFTCITAVSGDGRTGP